MFLSGYLSGFRDVFHIHQIDLHLGVEEVISNRLAEPGIVDEGECSPPFLSGHKEPGKAVHKSIVHVFKTELGGKDFVAVAVATTNNETFGCPFDLPGGTNKPPIGVVGVVV